MRPASTETPGVALRADDPAVERHADALLRRAGIATERWRGGSTSRVLVLLPTGATDQRLEAATAAAAAAAGAPLLLALPDDASSGSQRRALRSGVDGIVLDGELERALTATVYALAAGQLAVPPSLRRQLSQRHLSHREKQVLDLVVRGYTNRQIADELVLAESTVKTHLSSAFSKLEARSRSEAAAIVLDPEESHLRLLAVADSVAAPAV